MTLRLAGWIETFLTFVGSVSVVVLTVGPRWGSYLRALGIFSGGYVLMVSFIWISFGKYIGKTYPPHGGGDDGLVHDGYGRIMAMFAGQGDVIEALEGIEPIYWFTPGMRYVRMAEKLVFGDTNHLYALLLPCVPILVFYLIRHFVGTRWAWVTTAFFCLIPAGNLSFLQYMANAKLGYGEAAAGGLFLLGLVVMLRTQPEWGGKARNAPMAGLAGAALAASMFIRPNLALAVVWLGAAYAWTSWKRRDAATILAVAVGLGLALWLPFHNWFYGGEFYLISEGSSRMSLPLGVGDYVSALGGIARGEFQTPAVGELSAHLSRQLSGWLWTPGFLIREALAPLAWALHGAKLLALLISCWVAYRWVVGGFAKGTDLAVSP